jgi:lipopolysaccharide assembly outer membrane protein LptD (OstA)
MRFVLSIVMVAACTVLAAAQVAAPPVEVTTQHIRTQADGGIQFRGTVVIKVNGVEIRADEVDGTSEGRELTLRGNVRVVLPAPVAP